MWRRNIMAAGVVVMASQAANRLAWYDVWQSAAVGVVMSPISDVGGRGYLPG